MDIVSFSDRLKQITSTPTYQNADEETQQKIIRGEVDEFIRRNPREADAAYDVAESRYKDFRRNTGQGRYIPAGSVEGPWSDPNFDYLNPEEKEEAIKGFRNQIDAMASADPINREDLSYYYNTVADAYERRIRGEDTGWVMDKAYRAWDGLAGFLADAVGASDVANSIRRYSKENPKYDEDLTAMLAEGIGSVGASMAVFIGGSLIGGAATGGNPVGATVGGLSASLAANATVRYNEAYRKAVELGLDESQAVDAGIAAMPAAAIDALSDKLMGAATWSRATSTALKSGSTADKIKAIQALAKDRTARGIMLRASRDAFAEGMSEAVGDYVAGYGAYAVTGEDEFIPGSEELGKSFIVGAILGGGISVGGAAPGVLRGEKATLDAAAQQLQQSQDQESQQQITYSPESGARISGFGVSSQAMRLIASGRYREALDILKAETEAAPQTATDSTADSTISLEVTSSENPQFATAIGAFLPSTQEQESAGINVNSVRAFDNLVDNSDAAPLPFISREEQEAAERLSTLPPTSRKQFEEEAVSQFNRVYANNLEELAEAISQVPRSRAGVSGIRYAVLEEDEDFWNTPGAEFPIQEAHRVSNITLVPSGTDLSGEENVADFTVVERDEPEGSEDLSVQPSPELITKIREAVLRGRGNEITAVFPVNMDDRKWLKNNNVDVLKNVPLDGERDVRKSRWRKTTYYRATENAANFIADELDKKYGAGNWVLRDSVSADSRNIFHSRQDIIDRIREAEERRQQAEGDESVDIDPLYLNGLYAEPVNPALAGRPSNQDFQVHVIKRNGKVEVVPYATHHKRNAVPYIARTQSIAEIEQAALEYAESIQEEVAENALLGIDVVLGSTGEWIATEATPTQYGGTSNYYSFGGASGFVRTPYVASSIYSYLKGRPPAWVFAGRAVLRRELQKKAREQGAPIVSSTLSKIYGDVQDQVQFRAEILKTYGEQFADASGRLWAAFRESAGEITERILDLVRAILRSISSRIPAPRVSRTNSGIVEAVNQQANNNLNDAKQMTNRNSLDVPASSTADSVANSLGPNRKSDVIAPLRINGNLIRNSSEALDFLESQGVENLNKLVGDNQLVREALSNIPIFDSKGNGSFYDGTHIRIDGTVRLEDQLRLLEHELFHAVTETALRINDNFRTEVSAVRSDVLSHIASGEDGTYQNKVAKILQYARSLDPDSSMDAAFFNNQSEIAAYANSIKANPDMVRIAYALTSNSEFLSGLSDYAFRDLLQSVKAGSNRNLFQRIIDAIARFFTGNTQENTLEASERLIKGILDSDYKIQIKPINSIHSLDPKRVKSSLQNLVNLKKQNIADRFDINTSRLVNILKDFNLREINRLPDASRERVWDLIDNIYNSRSANTKNPAARIDTSYLIEELEAYKRIIDSIFIQQEIQRLDGVLDLSGYTGELDDREAFKEYVQSLQDEQGYQQQANLNRNAKRIAEYNKLMDAVRSKYAEIRDTIVEQYKDADGYVKSIEDNYGIPISSEKLKDFLKIHYDYLTQFADIASMEGDTLNAHFFAINNMLDGRWMNGKETTVEYIRKLRDSNVNFESLADKFRDPVINHGRGILGQIDQFNKLTEISQVQLERWSRFIEGKDFLQNDLAAGFMESLLLDAENAQNKAKDDYLTARDKILNGREMTTEDRITMSFASRLIQFNAGSDPNAAFLRNIANERKAFENIVGDPNSEDPKRRQGAGDPSFQREYREVIIPIFEKMVAGLEDSDQPMMDFMNNIEVRMGLGDQNLGAQRKAILQTMQDIQERFSLDNEIISELFYKKPFRRVVNYLPRAVVPINPTMNNDRDVTLENPIEDFENDKFQTSSMTAIPGQLMTRSAINNNSYYVNNIEHIFERGIRVAAITAHTTTERFILNARLRQDGPVANMINLSNSTYRTDQLKLWGVTLLRNAMQSGNPLGRPGEIMQEFGGAYARVALSGFHQGITQTVAGYVDYQIRTGNIIGAMQAASYYVANKAKMDQWFEENASRIANRSFLGERELDRRKSVELDENSIRNLPFVKKLSKLYDKAGDIITFSLRKGDDFSARSLILAEYHRLLQEKNPNIKTLNDVDWSTVEGDILTRAIGNIEQNINASNKVTRGEFFTDRSKGMMILRNTLFAFSQNVMQLAAQFNLAARDLWELHTLGGSDADKARAIRRMGAIISQTLAFSASRYIINGSLAYVMIGLIRDLFDDEDGKIAELALRVDQARMTGDDALVAQAEYELQGAIALRKQIEKFSNSNLSFESFFKNTMRETLGTMHFVFNGPAVPQKIVFNVVDTLGESIVKANKEEQVSAIKDKIKDARKKGNFGLAAKLTEDLAIFEAQEWLPFEFDQIRNTGMGGIYGAALGGIYSSLDEFVRYGAGLTEININDFMLAAQAAGLGQADLNRMFRVIDRIENDEFRRTKTFVEKTLPEARQREAEQKKRRDERELEKALREIFR